MKLTDLARRIGAAVLTPGRGPDVRIDQVYAATESASCSMPQRKRIAREHLPGSHLVRLAELMDVPASAWSTVSRRTHRSSRRQGTRHPADGLAGRPLRHVRRLYQHLTEEKRPGP